MTEIAPDNAAALYRALPAVVASVLGCTNHVNDIVESHDLAATLPAVPAYFSPLTKQVIVQPSLTQRLNDILTQPHDAYLRPQQAADEWKLKVFKTDLTLLIGRVAQGVGHQRGDVAEVEWDSLITHRHVHSLVFGISELVAELFVNDVIRQIGLASIDARLLEMEPLQRRYVAQATLLAEVLTEVARGRRTSLKDEVKILVRNGSAQLALWRLAERWGGHADFGNPRKLRKPGAVVDLRRSLEQTLLEMNREWADAA